MQPLPHPVNQSLNASVPSSLLKMPPQTLYSEPLSEGSAAAYGAGFCVLHLQPYENMACGISEASVLPLAG